jgi:hypothetical protein
MKIDPTVSQEVYDRWSSCLSDNGYESDEFIDAALKYEFGDTIPDKAKGAFDFSIVQSFKEE